MSISFRLQTHIQELNQKSGGGVWLQECGGVLACIKGLFVSLLVSLIPISSCSLLFHFSRPPTNEHHCFTKENLLFHYHPGGAALECRGSCKDEGLVLEAKDIYCTLFLQGRKSSPTPAPFLLDSS